MSPIRTRLDDFNTETLCFFKLIERFLQQNCLCPVVFCSNQIQFPANILLYFSTTHWRRLSRSGCYSILGKSPSTFSICKLWLSLKSLNQCPVCWLRMPNTVLNCVHIICLQCVQIIKASRRKGCPMCHLPFHTHWAVRTNNVNVANILAGARQPTVNLDLINFTFTIFFFLFGQSWSTHWSSS